MTLVFFCVLCLGGEMGWELFLLWRNFGYYRRLRKEGLPERIKAFFPQGYDASREIAYSLAGLSVGIVSQILRGGVLVLFLLLGGLGALSAWAVSLGGAGFGGSLLLMGVLVPASALLGIPLELSREFVVEARYGFRSGSWKVFWGDWFKSLGLQMVLMLPLFGVLTAFAASSELWYLWGGLVTLGVVTGLSALGPHVILPLFYTLKPLDDPELVPRIETLLRDASLDCEGVFVADESQRSRHRNAMVLGLGRSKRIVLFDTLLQDMDSEEVLGVIAHEVGHGVHHHIRRRLLLGAAVLGLFFLLLGGLWEVPFPGELGDTGGTVQGKLLLLLMAAGVCSGFVSGLLAPVYRRDEFQADAYAGKTVGRAPLQSALSKLATEELHWIPGDPLYLRWKASHPSLPERLQALEGIEKGERP